MSFGSPGGRSVNIKPTPYVSFFYCPRYAASTEVFAPLCVIVYGCGAFTDIYLVISLLQARARELSS